jgi:two-component system response regulator EvgA
VRLVHELHPDVVVLDLAMPGLDGLEAISLMRAVANPPAILVHSGFDAATMRDRVLALGAERYLEKGGNLGEVRTAVKDLLEARSQE